MNEANFSVIEMANFMLGKDVSENFKKLVYKIIMKSEYNKTYFDTFGKMFFSDNEVVDIVRKHINKKLDDGFVKSLFHMRDFVDRVNIEKALDKPHEFIKVKEFTKEEGYDFFQDAMSKL